MLYWSHKHLVGRQQHQAASRECRYQTNARGILSYWKQFHAQFHMNIIYITANIKSFYDLSFITDVVMSAVLSFVTGH